MTPVETARTLIHQTFPNMQLLTFERTGRSGHLTFALYGPEGARPSSTLLPEDHARICAALEPLLQVTTARHLILPRAVGASSGRARRRPSPT